MQSSVTRAQDDQNVPIDLVRVESPSVQSGYTGRTISVIPGNHPKPIVLMQNSLARIND